MVVPRKKILLPGLLVVPGAKNLRDSKEISFDFFIAEGSPADKFFFTSPGLRQAIEEFARKTKPYERLLPGYYKKMVGGRSRVGGVAYLYSKTDYSTGTPRKVYMESIFPFGDIAHKKISSILKHRGIGKGLQKISLSELIRLCGNVMLFPGREFSGEGRHMRAKLGIKINDRTSGYYLVSAKRLLQLIEGQERAEKRVLQGLREWRRHARENKRKRLSHPKPFKKPLTP